MMMKSPPKYPSSTLMLDQDFSVHISDILPPEVVAPLSNPPPVSIGSPQPLRQGPCLVQVAPLHVILQVNPYPMKYPILKK